MQDTVQMVEDLAILYKQICEQFSKLNSEVSRYDLMQQEILHDIETNTFNVVKGYFYAKSLKNIRLQRRKCKDEFRLLQSLLPYTQRCQKDLNTIVKRIHLNECTYNVEQIDG